jgi:hypothetical protein
MNRTIMQLHTQRTQSSHTTQSTLPRRQVQRVCSIADPPPGVHLLDVTDIPEHVMAQVSYFPVSIHISQGGTQSAVKLLPHNRVGQQQCANSPPPEPNVDELKIMVLLILFNVYALLFLYSSCNIKLMNCIRKRAN